MRRVFKHYLSWHSDLCRFSCLRRSKCRLKQSLTTRLCTDTPPTRRGTTQPPTPAPAESSPSRSPSGSPSPHSPPRGEGRRPRFEIFFFLAFCTPFAKYLSRSYEALWAIFVGTSRVIKRRLY